jgi:hypothetical protein
MDVFTAWPHLDLINNLPTQPRIQRITGQGVNAKRSGVPGARTFSTAPPL